MAKGKPNQAVMDDMEFIKGLAHSDKDVDGFVYGHEADDVIAPKYFYPTGLPPLDIIIGEGGFASGKITEIFGPERTGKSDLILTLCECFLNTFPDGIVVYYDQELSIDDKKLEATPVLRDKRMLIFVGKTAEKVFAHIESTVFKIAERKSTTPILIALDSVAALETEAQAEGEVGKTHVAPLPRVLSNAFRRIKPILQRTNAHAIFTNQIRDNIGAPAFVEPESPGGRALKFYADYRIRTSPRGNFYFKSSPDGTAKGYPDGLKIGFKTIKNKRVPPLREVEIPLIFERGPWGKSGFNAAWSVYYFLHKVKKITAAGGVNYITGSKDAGTFSKDDWGAIYSDPTHPITVAAMAALAEHGKKMMNSTSLGMFNEGDSEESIVDFDSITGVTEEPS